MDIETEWLHKVKGEKGGLSKPIKEVAVVAWNAEGKEKVVYTWKAKAQQTCFRRTALREIRKFAEVLKRYTYVVTFSNFDLENLKSTLSRFELKCKWKNVQSGWQSLSNTLDLQNIRREDLALHQQLPIDDAKGALRIWQKGILEEFKIREAVTLQKKYLM